MLKIKRVYDPPAADDGRRVLVDRLWPRGIPKAQAHVDEWLKDLAPSAELRKWFGHDPARWEEFRNRYRHELAGQSEAVEHLAAEAEKETVTLLFAAKDTEHNNAVVLKRLIEQRFKLH